MCGLVFAAGRHSLTASEIETFKYMLMFDTLRGEHSTGVFSLFRGYKQETMAKVVKKAVDGITFGMSPLFKEATTVMRAPTYGSSVPYQEFAKVLFGHNRHATLGAVNDKNAHPFTHGHITLVHNGTLRNQSLLPESKRFQVDSENIAYAISTIGADETIKKLNGAYCLIWYDANEQTVNFIRNSERPFHLWETSVGDWYGCSEEKMGDWLLTRGKVSKTFKRHFELEIGVQYVFDVSDGCVLKEERKHELPTFPVSTYDDWYSGYNRWNSSSSNQASERAGSNWTRPETSAGTTYSRKTPAEVIAEIVESEKIPLKLRGRIEFEAFDFKPYASEPSRGQIVGWLPTCTEYIEVQIHNVTRGSVVEDIIYNAEVVSAFEVNYLKTLVCMSPVRGRLEEVAIDDNPPFTPIPTGRHLAVVPTDAGNGDADNSYGQEVSQTFTGEIFSRKGWINSIHSTCAECGDEIPFDEMKKAHIMSNYCFCGYCMMTFENVSKLNDRIEDFERDEIAEALLEALGDDSDEVVELAVEEDEEEEEVLEVNPPRFQAENPVHLEKIKRFNGMYVTREVWVKMNSCRHCGEKIPYERIDETTSWGAAPVCPDCSWELRAFD